MNHSYLRIILNSKIIFISSFIFVYSCQSTNSEHMHKPISELSNSKDSMDKANEMFAKDVEAKMFPLFSEFATCADVPDVYHGWTFYIGDKKEFMPDFNSMD